MNDCYRCVHMRHIPGDEHIECSKPDLDMTGDEHGIKMGWFVYPLNFDPVWASKKCVNFERFKDDG